MPTGLMNGKYFTPEEIQERWEKYLQMCLKNTEETASAGKVVEFRKPLVPTMEGFRCFIGISRSSWDDYAKGEGSYAPYLHTTKNIKEYCHDAKVAALNAGQGSTAGIIFDLKCNYGWQEKQVIDTNVNIKADFGTDTIHPAPEATGDTSGTK